MIQLLFQKSVVMAHYLYYFIICNRGGEPACSESIFTTSSEFTLFNDRNSAIKWGEHCYTEIMVTSGPLQGGSPILIHSIQFYQVARDKIRLHKYKD